MHLVRMTYLLTDPSNKNCSFLFTLQTSLKNQIKIERNTTKTKYHHTAITVSGANGFGKRGQNASLSPVPPNKQIEHMISSS
jgi:hypothetical protein